MQKTTLRNEIITCGRDPCHFIRKYVRIKHPVKGLIPFEMFQYQEDLVRDYNDHRFNIVLKARQLGISEVTAAYATWLMLFHREKNIIVMASKAETAKNIIRKVATALKKLPRWLMLADVVTDNKLSIELSNGSRIAAIATSEDAGRSEAVSFLIIDEAAFVQRFDELWTGLYPTVAAGGRAVVLSTPNGVGNKFHQLYIDAADGNNEFKPHKFMWWLHPDRISDLRDDPDRPGFKTSSWFVNEIKAANMSHRDVAQELECVRAGTRIITPDGFKNIEDINVGDLVLTHMGRFREVVRLFNKEVSRDQVVKASLPMSRKNPLYITKNHPVMSLDGWKPFADDKRRYSALFPRLSDDTFKDTLRTIDLSLSQRCVELDERSCRYHRQKGRTERYVNVDYDLGRIVGLYLAEGYGDDRTTTFAFHRDEHDLIDFVSEWARKHGMAVNVQKRTYSACTTVSISNFFFKELLTSFVDGSNCHTKILTDKLYACSKKFVKGVIDGVWEGDGLHRPDKKNCLRLANERLVYQIRLLMTSFGLFTRVSYDGDRSWYVELNNVDGRVMRECTERGFFEKKQSRCKFADHKWWGNVKLQPAVDIEEDLTVYNIEVSQDNSYVCENLIVHNCNFNASGDTVISATSLSWILDSTLEPAEKKHWDRGMYVWFPPSRDGRYFVSADVARGDGKDFSAAHVWDAQSMSQVAEYYGKIPVEDFAKLLCDIGHEYNTAMLTIENSSIGLACIEHVRLLGYENVYFSRKGDHRPGEAVSMYWGPTSQDLVPGFTTSPKNRPLMIAKFEEYVRNRTISIRSKRMHEELRTFIWNNGRPEAMRGYNDDLVMAASIGVWIRDTFLSPSFVTTDIQKRMLSSIEMDRTYNTQIMGASKDPRVSSARQMGIYQKGNPGMQVRLPQGKAEDFSWLISKG